MVLLRLETWWSDGTCFNCPRQYVQWPFGDGSHHLATSTCAYMCKWIMYNIYIIIYVCITWNNIFKLYSTLWMFQGDKSLLTKSGTMSHMHAVVMPRVVFWCCQKHVAPRHQGLNPFGCLCRTRRSVQEVQPEAQNCCQSACMRGWVFWFSLAWFA